MNPFTYVFFPFGFRESSCADRGLGSRVLLVHRVLHMEVISCMRLAPVQPLHRRSSHVTSWGPYPLGWREVLSWGRIYGGMESVLIFYSFCYPSSGLLTPSVD